MLSTNGMEYKVHEPFLGRRPSIPSPMEGSAESLPDAVPTNFPDVFPDLKDVPLVYVLHVLAQQRDLYVTPSLLTTSFTIQQDVGRFGCHILTSAKSPKIGDAGIIARAKCLPK